MPLRLTSAPVSGLKNRKSSAPRPRGSPFAGHARRKPNTQPGGVKKAAASHAADDDEQPLPDTGVSQYIPETASVEDVVQAIESIRDTMFEEVPQRAGMNSTRIAQVLTLRRSLPPLASVAHVHTLLNGPTRVEKEIFELVTSGRVKRLVVPGRGTDAAGLGDCLVLAEDLEQLVRQSDLNEHLQVDKFLQTISKDTSIPTGAFAPDEYLALVRAGFLVSGRGAPPTSVSLSLPNTGPYLRLLSAGRNHLVALLRKSSYNEAPLELLRDRWDGAVESERSFSVAKRARGEFAGILPGKTKKWRELYGISFRWAVEEALGAGVIEIFDTGSVGVGVRLL
ncbi:hypothetical protein ASPZODRAFT_104338 [Penicilliopsis zonata CBS 506.65]|uniref:Serine-threonine protein kinase 19 n=1 Tax=Penicilliopsis zonata CBS 506.65 TaxID=1073090 RepID=A0A1L9S748_9EURO|nr:hypothetical protein ASPZODRAFT_104338 [Penicilliopsis zonata CBS 506.65]OJJ42987.1 hypothetical protein ASPZODRAFT_104338 [Penicilliopsis zonata CBS 506.65]